MRWSEKQRQGFIGERLLAGCYVNRADLMKRFGISVAQASLDIRRFLKAHPSAMRYDRTKKAYVRWRLSGGLEAGRDTTAAAKSLIGADDAWLQEVALRDPSMIRDVAAALIYERDN